MTIEDTTRRTALRALGAGGLLALGGAGTVAARTREGASADGTVADIAAGNPAFSVLVEALEETGLDTVLAGRRQFTVFAPTDDAFGDLLAELGVSKAELLARPDLADILLFHVVPGRRYSPSVLGAPRLPTLNGTPLTQSGGVLDGRGAITATDLEASNGVVHVVDGVLLP